MNRATSRTRTWSPVFLSLLLMVFLPGSLRSQAVPYARSFAKSKEEVDQALKTLQAYSGQKLPILEGFVAVGNKPLNRYERGFYQFSIELLQGDAGATVVRISAKITAWYADRDLAKSGYEQLASNGRLELDLLDRLEENLSGKVLSSPPSSSVLQAPRPKIDLSGVPRESIPSPSRPVDQSPDEVASLRVQRIAREKRVQQLTTELQSLKEIQRNQAHPANLVIVKKSGTPILAKGSANSRILFRAAANDEFEFLDVQDEWIHVSISGDSRGYVNRDAVELPQSIASKLDSPHTDTANANGKTSSFRIEREETSIFPGDWPPLRGKAVKIYTVQPVSVSPRTNEPAARLDYTLALFERVLVESAAAAPPASSPEGVVVIFDSANGGIAAATLADIQKIASGSITKEAFWIQSYLDPAEVFRPGGN